MEINRLLDGLNKPQIEAVTAEDGRVVVLAGAGSGKTRVLTRRIAWRVAQGHTDPNRVLALTFTRKAAAELRDRQRRLGFRDPIPAGTFHSFALAQLRQRWTEKRTVPPTLVVSKMRLIAQLGKHSPDVELLDLVAEVDWARARMLSPEEYSEAAIAAGRASDIDHGLISELMTAYQKEKRRKRVVDFDDLLMLAIRDLRADPDYAEAVRWRHRHFYVDEFQDVNPLQFELLNEWLGDRDDLFLVGDPRQAIYAWNGAEPDLLAKMATSVESTTIELNDNYRSTPQVLALAGTALQGAFVNGSNNESEQRNQRSLSLVAHRPDGPTPTLSSYDDDRAEAAGVAQAVRQANASGARWSEQAVLVRTNAQLVIIEQELTAANVPRQVRTGPGPLGSPEVKAVLKEIGRQGIDLIQQLEDLDERLSEPLGDQANAAAPSHLDRHNNLAALSRLIHDYLTTDPIPDGPGFLAWVETMTGGDVGVTEDAVDLVTFHGAKGLEWPVVHIAGLEDGFVPIAYAKTPAQNAEEQRLLYVALTRAQDQLHLSWARARTFGTKTVNRSASPTVAALDHTIKLSGGVGSAQPNWRSHIAESRRAINSAEDEEQEPRPKPATETNLYEDLVAWRSRKARASGVPPHVIVSDQTLRQVAEHRPTSRTQLAAVTGLRPAKLSRIGDELLAQLSDYQSV